METTETPLDVPLFSAQPKFTQANIIDHWPVHLY